MNWVILVGNILLSNVKVDATYNDLGLDVFTTIETLSI